VVSQQAHIPPRGNVAGSRRPEAAAGADGDQCLSIDRFRRVPRRSGRPCALRTLLLCFVGRRPFLDLGSRYSGCVDPCAPHRLSGKCGLGDRLGFAHASLTCERSDGVQFGSGSDNIEYVECTELVRETRSCRMLTIDEYCYSIDLQIE
jgi:hypothetical protein